MPNSHLTENVVLFGFFCAPVKFVWKMRINFFFCWNGRWIIKPVRAFLSFSVATWQHKETLLKDRYQMRFEVWGIFFSIFVNPEIVWKQNAGKIQLRNRFIEKKNSPPLLFHLWFFFRFHFCHFFLIFCNSFVVVVVVILSRNVGI